MSGSYHMFLAQLKPWTPGFNDPTPLGFAVCAAYLLVAWLAYRAWRGERGTHTKLARAWFVLMLLLLLLGINKQVDMQTLATQIARTIAKDNGWYRERKAPQLIVLAIACALALCTVVWIAWTLRRELRRIWPALMGLTLIGVYIAARVTSVHVIDGFLRSGPIKIMSVVEPVGLALIAWGIVRGTSRRVSSAAFTTHQS
ncbi:MAG: hypothetical protein DWH97_12800 [Planctomycetota bacterium]|nr:MAG: hypothetical protein DWH97_12800 [Planctomycetota bacterium]